MSDIYKRFSHHLFEMYGEKVYKLPVNLPLTCPNRLKGKRGCSYCGIEGAGFENLSSAFSVREQLEKNKEYIGRRYKAKKFVAYFQSFTNTFMPLNDFEAYINEAAKVDDVVEISVSTRPDCISKEYLDVLKAAKNKYGVNITVELGLQTVNYRSLYKINRGHTVAEFVEAAGLVKKYGFFVCVHIILNLPWDDIVDVIENAKFVSAMKVDYVKLHALYIEKGTVMAEQYEKGEIEICSVEEYEQRVITFLEYLSPEIALERLIGRAPAENTLFSNWGMSWWKIRDEIELKMEQIGSYQGKRFDYLGGKGVKCFIDGKY